MAGALMGGAGEGAPAPTGWYLRSIRLDAASLTAGDGDAWPYTLPAVAGLGRFEPAAGATFLVGENGAGKSTLVEAIALAAGLNAHGGSRNLRTAGHGTESSLHQHLVLSWRRRPTRDFFLRAETFLDTVTAYDALGGGLGAGLARVSHGESVLGLVGRLRGQGLLLLADEPEAGLSMTGQLALLRRLHELVGAGAQVIVATHSPVLAALPGARVYELDDDGIRRTAWDETDAVVLARHFLAAPDRYLHHLLRNE
ncbi:MAG: AAA family ATPase [Acidimicrobiales bacterium]